MEKQSNFLFVEETNKDHITTLHPITIKFEGRLRSWNDIKEECIPRIEYTSELSIKHLQILPKHNRSFVIVGTGPTLYGFEKDLSSLKDNTTNTICSVNKSHEFLIKRNIIPNIHVFFERDIHLAEQSLGGQPHKDVTYYISSTCDQNLFKQLKDHKCVLWHTEIPNEDYRNLISSYFPNEPFIGIGPSSFLKTFNIGQLLGYNNYKFYGIDGSLPVYGPDHISEYKVDDPEERFSIWAMNPNGELRKYFTNMTLMMQTIDFVNYCKEQHDLDIKVHGEGLLGFVSGSHS